MQRVDQAMAWKIIQGAINTDEQMYKDAAKSRSTLAEVFYSRGPINMEGYKKGYLQ